MRLFSLFSKRVFLQCFFVCALLVLSSCSEDGSGASTNLQGTTNADAGDKAEYSEDYSDETGGSDASTYQDNPENQSDDPTTQSVDSDGDGILDQNEPDDDGDGIINDLEPDTDQDGIIDDLELDTDQDGIIDDLEPDTDGDGIIDDNEPDDDGDGIINDDEPDTDGDGIINDLEPDTDGDGTIDDNEPDDDGDGIINDLEPDTDGDGIIDDLEPDTDGDGTIDDNEPDTDGDGIIDDLEPDTDGDGIIDDDDPDANGDGYVDGEEPDTDGDGILDQDEPDTDGDGIIDDNEPDMDGDGIIDDLEPDTDGDGIIDDNEPDTDGDGIIDDDEADTDGDGIIDDDEADTDGDGIIDDNEPDDDGDGIINDDEPDTDGDGIINDLEPDTDGDGIIDDNEPDTDGDGIIDDDEADTDGDGIIDDNEPDTDGDGIIDDLEPDTDGDGIIDDYDSDANGDGLDDSMSDGGTITIELEPEPEIGDVVSLGQGGGPDDSGDVPEDGTDTDGDGIPDNQETGTDPVPAYQFVVGGFKIGWNLFTQNGTSITGNYEVKRGTDLNSMTTIATVDVQSLSDANYTDTNLVDGQVYYYRVTYGSGSTLEETPAIVGWGISHVFTGDDGDTNDDGVKDYTETYNNGYETSAAEDLGFSATLGDPDITVSWPSAFVPADYTFVRYDIFRAKGEDMFNDPSWWAAADQRNVVGNDVRKLFDASTNYWEKVRTQTSGTSWTDSDVGPGVHTYVVAAVLADSNAQEVTYLGAPVPAYRAFQDNREFVSYAMETWLEGMYMQHYWPNQAYANEPVDSAEADNNQRYPIEVTTVVKNMYAYGRKGGWYMTTTVTTKDTNTDPEGNVVGEGEHFGNFRNSDIEFDGSFTTAALPIQTYNSSMIQFNGVMTVKFVYKDAIIDTAYFIIDAARGMIGEGSDAGLSALGDVNLGQFFYWYDDGGTASYIKDIDTNVTGIGDKNTNINTNWGNSNTYRRSRIYYTQSQADVDAYTTSDVYPAEYYNMWDNEERTSSSLFKHTYSIIKNPFMHGGGETPNPDKGDYQEAQNDTY